MSRSKCKLLLAGAAPGLVAAVLFGASPAGAVEATATQASSMEAQVRDALGSLLGPSVKLSERPMQITASGDHFDIVVPIHIEKLPLYIAAPATGGLATPAQPVQITGTARPGDNGIWIVENVKVTSPVRFTVMVPTPAPNGGSHAPTATTPVTYTLQQTGQDGRIVWDPTFTTPSTWTATSQSTTLHAEGDLILQNTTVGPTSAVTTMRPSGQDRVDVLLDGTLGDYKVDGAQSAIPIQVAMQRLRVTSAMTGISRARGMRLMQSLTALIAAGAPKGANATPTLIKAMLEPLQDLASDFMLDENGDGFVIQTQGQSVLMDRLRLGFDARSDAGLIRGGMNVGIEGLHLPAMPLGDLADLIPQRIELRPVVGGVAAADLLRVANLASDNRDPAPDDIAALFSHGGVTGGIESMTVEVGGATFTGQGSVVATAPLQQAVSGTAQIIAENFDALIQKVTAVPAMAQQALPVMVFIKGIGRTVDNKLVWDIVYKDDKVLINNVDLTAMAGGGAEASPPPRSADPGPAPNRAAPGGALKQPGRGASQGRTPSWGK